MLTALGLVRRDYRSPMNLAVLAAVFGVIFVAELPGKTALASLVLGTRGGEPGHGH
jgi:putative Ca2+/H+ antiporter (TMEM165/GDT1 family)